MQRADAIPHDRPVFVLAQHRSGGTLLTRLLNCHPDLVIWGEHAGFINKLAEAHAVLARHQDLLDLEAQVSRDGIGNRGRTRFQPWANPFTVADVAEGCRSLIRGLFTRGIAARQRWGFKEIRYHSPVLAGFLRLLFPASRFILMDRDPIELCVSNMLVSWSLDRLLADGIQLDRTAFLGAVEDCLYGITVIRRNLAAIAAELGDRCIPLDYAALSSDPRAEMERVFAFLELPSVSGVGDCLDRAGASTLGATDKRPFRRECLGLLNAATIREAALAILPLVITRIERDGIDLPRLRRERATGRYSWLMGDHGVAESPLSSMF
jgi:hypothetical protein